MDQKVIVGGATAAALAIIAGGYFWLRDRPAATPPPAQVAEQPLPAADHYPVPDATPEQRAALPELNASDATVLDELKSLFSVEGIAKHLVPQDVVRHAVATIDNLPRKKIAERLKPITPTTGKFLVSGSEDAPTLSADNAARYRSFVQMVNAADMQKVAAGYFRLYPLFQEAYVDLGYPSGYFNDRLVEVLDNLLATPDVSGPIALTQPGVMYEYADPALENLSAGQKAILRSGSENSAILKTKLRELREAVAKKPK